jgi:hypothetical protein
MSAIEAIKAARDAGIDIRLDGDDLVLEASAPPLAPVIDLLARHKSGIVALLRPDRDGWSADDWRQFYDERAGIAEYDGGFSREDAERKALECCVAHLIDTYSDPSEPDKCAQCGGPEMPGASLVPVGSEITGHTWLHLACWSAWYQGRRERALSALATMGLK